MGYLWLTSTWGIYLWLTGHALNFVNILNTEVTNKIIAGDDSLFNTPVEVHSRVSFSQLRNGLCTKCMY